MCILINTRRFSGCEIVNKKVVPGKPKMDFTKSRGEFEDV